MDQVWGRRFVDQWLRDWNAPDLEGLLSHYSEDVVFTSPVAAQLLEESDGIVHGKDEVRNYWAEGLRRIPDLHFEVVGYYVGVQTLVINYRNQRGALVAEVLEFEGAEIVAGHGTYLSADDNPAGASPR
jgi:ketosteroid isomerase-like protein